MIQKKIWKFYLIIGISFILMINCENKGDVDYRLDTDVIFKNRTDQLIRYYHIDSSSDFRQFVFELLPNKEIRILERSNGSKTNLDNCCQGIFEDFQGNLDILIDYNNGEKCLVYLSGEGSTTSNINVAYERQEIETGYYQFIYTFTENEYNLASECN